MAHGLGAAEKPTRVPADVQHEPYFAEGPVYLGPMTGATWRWNPRRLGMMLARYKFCSKMLAGKKLVAEIGAADGFGSEVVRREVGRLDLYDYDPVWDKWSQVWNIVRSPLPLFAYDAIYMLDVLEHIYPADEDAALTNICKSLKADGVLVCGCPSLESQVYASDVSKIGHVNCKTGDKLRDTMLKYFDNVFSFGMNDEVLHTGFHQMCHYLFVVCAGPKIRD